jgi:hypothetical protein
MIFASTETVPIAFQKWIGQCHCKPLPVEDTFEREN